MLCLVLIVKKDVIQLQNIFLGVFAKLQKTTISFVMSVCNNSAPTEWIFMKFDI